MILFFFFFLAVLHGLRDLSSSTRDGTVPPAVEAQSPNHWTAREFHNDSFPITANKESNGI